MKQLKDIDEFYRKAHNCIFNYYASQVPAFACNLQMQGIYKQHEHRYLIINKQ